MKLKKKGTDYDSNFESEGYDTEISADKLDKLQDLLENPYKDPISSLVREYSSNAVDSHLEANIDEPIVVCMDKDDTGIYWSVEDFGVGISPDRIKNVFVKYLESTKENTDNQIGAFGLGSKSGLGYTNIVHIRTRYEGTEYQYMLRKGEKSPRLDKIIDIPTTEKNGTEIKVYLNETSHTTSFVHASERQLAYFDNVYFTGQYLEYNVNNDYTIYEGKHFKYRPDISLYGGSTLHLSIGNVPYPIDWATLDMKQIDFPLALKFEIGELDIIFTREDVKYTDSTVANIKAKINQLADDMANLWNKHVDPNGMDDIIEYQAALNSRRYLDSHISDDISTNRLPLRKISVFSDIDINTPYLTVEKQYGITFKPRFFNEYSRFYKPSFLTKSGSVSDKTPYGAETMPGIIGKMVNNDRSKETFLYRKPSTVKSTPKKNKYLAFKHGVKNSRYYSNWVILVTPDFEKRSLTVYRSWIDLKDKPKEKWRKIIVAVQELVKNTLLNVSSSYKELDKDEGYIRYLEEEKQKRLKKKEEKKKAGKFTMYPLELRDHSSYHDTGVMKDFKYTRCNYNVNNVIRKGQLVVYGTKDDKPELEMAMSVLYNYFGGYPTNLGSQTYDYTVEATKRLYSKYTVMYVAKTNLDRLESLNNSIHVSDFMKEPNKYTTKVVTSYFLSTQPNFKMVDTIIANKEFWNKVYSPLVEYAVEVGKESRLELKYRDSDFKKFLSDMLGIFQENNWLNQNTISKFEFIQRYMSGLEILNHVSLASIDPIEVVKLIDLKNKAILDLRERKKLNPYWYVNLRAEERKWLEENKKENEYYISRRALKKQKLL